MQTVKHNNLVTRTVTINEPTYQLVVGAAEYNDIVRALAIAADNVTFLKRAGLIDHQEADTFTIKKTRAILKQLKKAR